MSLEPMEDAIGGNSPPYRIATFRRHNLFRWLLPLNWNEENSDGGSWLLSMTNYTRRRRRSLLLSVSEQTLTVKCPGWFAPSWCGECAEQVRMIRPDEAAIVAAVTPRKIYQWIEAGRLHYSEQPTGALLVCFNSLRFSSMAAVEVDACEFPAGSICEKRGSES